jgi:hypothetical protein
MGSRSGERVVADFTILALEIGCVGGAVAITQGVRSIARRIHQARTASGIRKMLRTQVEEPASPPIAASYRDNVAMAVEAEAPSPGFVERWRAKRVATYVHELERRAKIDA